jgi:Tfp pilus assembly protein FimV
MSIKSLLLTGAIAAVTLTTAAAPGFAASSDTTKAQVEAMRKAMQAQIDELKAQVQQLTGQQQATQAQTQVTAQKVDTAVAAVEKVTPPKGKKGIQIGSVTSTPGGFIEAAGLYREKNMTSDIDTNFNNTPYKNSSNAYVDENRFSARQSRLSLLATSDIDELTHAGAY